MWVGCRAGNTLGVFFAVVVQCAAAPPAKPFVECDRAQLIEAVPELGGIQFETNQDRLDGLLKHTGETLQALFAKLGSISAAEALHELRFEDSMVETNRRESFRYVVKPLTSGSSLSFDEFRIVPATGAASQAQRQADFLIAGHFFQLLLYLLPEFRDQSQFRYLGRGSAAGRDFFLVAFGQRPDSTLQSPIASGSGHTELLQGLVWIDSATNRVNRVRFDLLEPGKDFAFQSLTIDLSFASQRPASVDADLWLPLRATVHARYSGGEVHTVHRYSDYRAYGVDEKEEPATLPSVAEGGEDGWELVDRGISLAKENKSSEAIASFREALRLNPKIPLGRFELAVALRESGDFAGAETELRGVAKLVPNFGPVHNFLGILLFKRGDTAGAVEELRSSARLQPKEATAHFNLAQALEKHGDRNMALEEYRTASTLAPENSTFKERLERTERAASVSAAATAETAIKVEVRQVLVPVIVTGAEGHRVTSLKQADFRVFEDGVEQKITGFSVEDAATSPSAPAAGGGEPNPERPESAAKQRQIRRTYLICVDSFHSAFGSLAHIREALTKMFREEQSGDSQYLLVALGASLQVLQNPTTDPEAILKAITAKTFERMFLDSRQSSGQAEMREFRRSLDRARDACDHRDPECPSLKRMLPSQANEFASRDRIETLGFLSQLRAVVQTLARGTERRSIVLLSDGFQMVPGKMAFELLAAYFPEMRMAQLRAIDRMQELEPILRLAANSNIPIYTIDSRGLYTSGFYDAANSGGSIAQMPAVQNVMDENATSAGQTLSEIAAATGGTAFQNSNNILRGLERAFADGRQYYMLAYVSTGPNQDGKFHAISVRVRDGKMVVNAKRGYWATGN